MGGRSAGETGTVYYNDGDTKSAGIADYALITDFESNGNDTIQLFGSSSDYSLGVAPGELPFGTGIFFNDGATPELIGLITDISPDTLNLDDSSQFIFV
ncbi:hypothetical protein [Mastigocoleus testarum]|uniref:Uncharacterized protein n=1 Tax=Mastigocoleus testarum BC008 TaxID=371196 RepID=A0A0V7ZEK0_9CYAN|nr:hypothetical protein [Mastigocoleus testarum]KST62662.1 hypothetical protein BC008_38185 [Mastigocoleus testarum BC008]